MPTLPTNIKVLAHQGPLLLLLLHKEPVLTLVIVLALKYNQSDITLLLLNNDNQSYIILLLLNIYNQSDVGLLLLNYTTSHILAYFV